MRVPHKGRDPVPTAVAAWQPSVVLGLVFFLCVCLLVWGSFLYILGGGLWGFGWLFFGGSGSQQSFQQKILSFHPIVISTFHLNSNVMDPVF